MNFMPAIIYSHTYIQSEVDKLSYIYQPNIFMQTFLLTYIIHKYIHLFVHTSRTVHTYKQTIAHRIMPCPIQSPRAARGRRWGTWTCCPPPSWCPPRTASPGRRESLQVRSESSHGQTSASSLGRTCPRSALCLAGGLRWRDLQVQIRFETLPQLKCVGHRHCQDRHALPSNICYCSTTRPVRLGCMSCM